MRKPNIAILGATGVVGREIGCNRGCRKRNYENR